MWPMSRYFAIGKSSLSRSLVQLFNRSLRRNFWNSNKRESNALGFLGLRKRKIALERQDPRLLGQVHVGLPQRVGGPSATIGKKERRQLGRRLSSISNIRLMPCSSRLVPAILANISGNSRNIRPLAFSTPDFQTSICSINTTTDIRMLQYFAMPLSSISNHHKRADRHTIRK